MICFFFSFVDQERWRDLLEASRPVHRRDGQLHGDLHPQHRLDRPALPVHRPSRKPPIMKTASTAIKTVSTVVKTVDTDNYPYGLVLLLVFFFLTYASGKATIMKITPHVLFDVTQPPLVFRRSSPSIGSGLNPNGWPRRTKKRGCSSEEA